MTLRKGTEYEYQRLLEEARRGDRRAFEALVANCRADLEQHVQRRIGEHLRSKVDVEDVLQETYTQAWKSIEGFHWTGAGCFLGWLRAIAEHVILKAVRQQRRRPVLYVEHDTPSREPSPSRSLQREERFDRLEAAIDSLSPDYRQAIRLVRIEGLPVTEAARRMNRTPKSVMHLVSRALKKLRDAIGETESFHLPPRLFENRREET